MNININSILSHIDELRILAEEYQLHITGINETKLDDLILDNELRIYGHKVIIRKDRNRHGVAFCVKYGLEFNQIEPDLRNLELITIRLAIPHVKAILVTTGYGPPDSEVKLSDDFEEILRSLDAESHESIIMGGMNCDYLKPDNNNTKHMKRIFHTYGYTQMIGEPTRTTDHSKILIDYMATNRPDCVSDQGVLPYGISDHDVVYMTRSMKKPRVKMKPKIVETRKYSTFDSEQFRNDLQSMPFDEIKNITAAPNEMWAMWKKFFLDVLNKHAPLTKIKVKGNNLPYIDSETRQANQTGSKYLSQAFQHVQHKVQYRIRNLPASYYKDKVEENKGDIITGTWKILKQAINKDSKGSDIEMLKVNDRNVKGNDEIAKPFNEHFVSIGEKLAKEIDPVDISLTQQVKQTESKFRFRKISSIKVFDTLNKLKNGKLTGLFHMPNKALNIAKDLIAASLTDIFNACIETRIFQDDLKIGKVTPIFKSERKDDLNNYRLITVLPTVTRVMERLIYKQIYDYFNREKLPNKNQWGFRSFHSLVLALSDCSNDWLFNMDKGMINSGIS